MPANTEPRTKNNDLTIERTLQRYAIARLRATMHPVYFVPATAPAKAPGKMAKELRGKSLNRVIAMTPIVAKKAIQRSGAPEREICQKTTGVTRNTRATIQDQRRSIHWRARQKLAKAVNTPPRNISPVATRLLPTASPAKIKR